MSRRFVIVLAAASALVAACGSSAKHTAGGGSSPSSGHVANLSPITLMTIHTAHSSTFSNPEIADAAQAAMNVINQAGGINGHPLKLIDCNDGNDPNLAAQCGAQALSAHVSALVGSQSVYSSNYYADLQQGNIPNIGDSATTADDNTSPLSFAYGASPPLEFAGLGETMANANCKKIALLAPDIAALKISEANFKAGVANVNNSITIEPTINFPLGNADDSPQAAKVASLGADCAVAFTDVPDMAALLGRMHQLAPTVKVGWIANELDPNTLKGVGAPAEGQYSATQAVPLGTVTPDTAAFLSEMQKDYPSAVPDELAENAWAAVMVFAKVAKALNSYDSASVLAALGKQCSLSVPLYTTVNFCQAGPLAKAPRLFNTKVYALKVHNGAYVLANPTPVDVATALANSAGV